MEWNLMTFQNSMSPMMHHLNMFHNYMMMFIFFIMMMILFLFMKLIYMKYYSNKIIDHQWIETLWTLFPMIILIFLAIPSIKILYLMEQSMSFSFSIKSTGNQWYWNYEYPQFGNVNFDSYMITTPELTIDNYRLLDVDNKLLIPTNCLIRVMTTSNDVIHAFTVPSLAIKIDSIPGRINQCIFSTNMPQIFYGQCSEICGANHSFMPIVMLSMLPKNFIVGMKYNLMKNF